MDPRNINVLDEHPVVHVAYRRRSLCKWAGKELPNEAEWGIAARGGLTARIRKDEQAPAEHMANTWQGISEQNLRPMASSAHRLSPLPANDYGLHDMIGNVWEWTADWYSQMHEADAPKACCIPENPRGGPETASCDSCQPNIRIPRKVLKGGSHLCAPNYCRRYRPAARHAEPVDTSASHVGFRCITRKRIKS
jgi:formylglycine-generating enzyme required for sulfatase activity